MVLEAVDTMVLKRLEAGCQQVLGAHRSTAWNTTEVTDLLGEVQSILKDRRPSGKYRP